MNGRDDIYLDWYLGIANRSVHPRFQVSEKVKAVCT
jgi:hypothetical protein